MSTRFRQEIQPSRQRGCISYLMDTIYGEKRVEGPRCSEHFAARRCDERRFWVLTHLPSGKCIPGATRRVLKRTQQIAFLLEQEPVQWSRRSPRMSKALIARLKDVVGVIPVA